MDWDRVARFFEMTSKGKMAQAETTASGDALVLKREIAELYLKLAQAIRAGMAQG